MYQSNTKSFSELRNYLEQIPVIETHEHYTNYAKAENTLNFILGNYYNSDYISAGGEEEQPKGLSPKERYEQFIRIYRKSDKTAYARCMQEGLRQCWGVTSIDSWHDFQAFEAKLKTRTAAVYEQTMEKLKIRAKVVDIYDLPVFMSYVDGKKKTSQNIAVLPFPFLHSITCIPRKIY